MNGNESNSSNDLRETAQRMIRCMGATDALACCINNQWVGLWREIRTLTVNSDARR